MKENKELERADIAIDRDMEVDCDIGKQITVYIETWFDTDKKFKIHTDADEGTWLNMYGRYNPFADRLSVECVISSDDGDSTFDYNPTAAEAQLIKDMITEKIREVHGQTPQEFCNSFAEQDEKVYVYVNTAKLNAQTLHEKNRRIKAHCEENGYLKDGCISISAPMVRCGDEFQRMIDYCKSRGISKILVDSLHDIGSTPAEVNKVVGILCSHDLNVEVSDCGLTFAADNKASLPNDEEGQGFVMGGM